MGVTTYTETLRSVVLNPATSGDNTVIAAPTEDGQYICIDFIAGIAAGAVNVTLKDGTTALTGVVTLAQNQAFVFENAIQNDDGIITLSPKTAFVVNLSGNVGLNGFIRYRLKGGK